MIKRRFTLEQEKGFHKKEIPVVVQSDPVDMEMVLAKISALEAANAEMKIALEQKAAQPVVEQKTAEQKTVAEQRTGIVDKIIGFFGVAK